MSELDQLNKELEELNSLTSLIKGIVNRGEVNSRKRELAEAEARCLALVDLCRGKFKKGVKLQSSENMAFQVSRKNFEKLLAGLTTQLNRVKSLQEDEQQQLRR